MRGGARGAAVRSTGATIGVASTRGPIRTGVDAVDARGATVSAATVVTSMSQVGQWSGSGRSGAGACS